MKKMVRVPTQMTPEFCEILKEYFEIRTILSWWFSQYGLSIRYYSYEQPDIVVLDIMCRI